MPFPEFQSLARWSLASAEVTVMAPKKAPPWMPIPTLIGLGIG